MNKLLAILALCPMAASAATWTYDGQATGGGSTAAPEPAMTETNASTGSMSMAPTAGPAPANAPANSTTMSKVREVNGEPERIMEGVGDPPITRWQYPGYVVYFEYDKVIISVAGRW